MSNKDIIATFSGLQKQGVQMLITEDGWKEFVKALSEENKEIESDQAV